MADATPGRIERCLWDRLGEMGVLGHARARRPAAGSAWTSVDLVLLLEETGRAALPEPLVEHRRGRRPADRRRRRGRSTTDLGGPYVSCAADADRLLLYDPDGRALHLVDPADVTLDPVATVDGARRAATVEWQPAPGTLVSDDPAAARAACDRGACGTAAAARRAWPSACST